MQQYSLVSAVTLVFGFVLFGMSVTVSRLRVTRGVAAPSVGGDAVFERAFRAHLNTVEWTPIFLPAMWLFAAYWDGRWAAGLGAVWVAGRVAYFVGYVAGAERRFLGMSIQAAACLALAAGALGRIVFLGL